MPDFAVTTPTGSTGYYNTSSDYARCRQDIVLAARAANGSCPIHIEGSSLAKIESVAGRLPEDVRSRLGMQ